MIEWKQGRYMFQYSFKEYREKYIDICWQVEAIVSHETDTNLKPWNQVPWSEWTCDRKWIALYKSKEINKQQMI